jgi:predicted Abi (CAAX) family protease
MIEASLRKTAKRLRTGLTTWPNRRAWLVSLWVFLVYAVLAWGFGFGSGLYRYDPQLDHSLLRVAIIAFFVPAIGEEMFFRGAIVPTGMETENAFPQMVLALAIFLAWHPFNAWLFFPEVLPLFSDWRFLTVTAMLGIACTYLWRTTGSLWPSIGLHWVAVIIWKAFLGAPRML